MLLKTCDHLGVTIPEQLFHFIAQYGDECVFPNLRVSQQILLTVAISTTSCKRSIIKLKLILSSFRAPVGEARLSGLALLSVERKCKEKINLYEVTGTFALVKARQIDV